MSYQQGYPQGQYAGYQGYGQPPQTHMYQANQTQYQQPPMVAIPVQPRHEVPNFQTSPHPQQPHFQPGGYQQPPTQYHSANQQQYYAPQRQQYPPSDRSSQQPGYYPQQFSNQNPYQQSWSQPGPPIYQPDRTRPPQVSPQFSYQQQPGLYGQSASPQFQPQPLSSHSSSHSLPPGSQPYVNPQVLVNPSTRQSHVQTPRAQQSTQQQAQILSSPDPLQQSQPPKRVVARVEIPTQKPVPTPTKSEMQPPMKRRRSNDGHAIAVCEIPVTMKRNLSQQHVQAPYSSPLTELTSSQMPPTPTPQPRAEHQPVLLALADEYIHAAYGMSSTVASDEQRDEYLRLVSMGMACLQSLLDNYRQTDARREARIRLRLATLMVDETDNDEQIEEIVSKGVSLCERNRLVDLKYAMQHLSVRSMFRKSPKAALKAADYLIQEVETLRLHHWIYKFRFLRTSLSLQLGGHADLTAALKQLNSISALAENQANVAVQVIAATLEAIVHLRTGSSEVVDLTQRAMAAARTHQLSTEMQAMPQIRGLLDCLDLACSLLQFNQDQADAKMQLLQANLDKGTRDAGWSKDGSFTVVLSPTDNEYLEQDANGILRSRNGNACLVMKWITAGQLYTLGFLLSGSARLQQNSSDGKKIESFLEEGFRLTKVAPSIRQSLTSSEASAEQHKTLSIAMRLYIVFARCGHGDWQAARAAIRDLRKLFSADGAEVDEPSQRMLIYLEAMCRQGLGELKGALELYDSPLLAANMEAKARTTEKDLRALATLNRVFVLRMTDDEESVQAENLVTAIESYCLNHSNKSLVAAFHLVKATASGTEKTILKAKQYLQSAIQASKAAANSQLLCILMNFMTNNYFGQKIVGDQAERAAGVGRALAKKSRSKLWMAVADGMYGEIMERCGKPSEAEAARREAQNLYADLPESLKEIL